MPASKSDSGLHDGDYEAETATHSRGQSGISNRDPSSDLEDTHQSTSNVVFTSEIAIEQHNQDLERVECIPEGYPVPHDQRKEMPVTFKLPLMPHQEMARQWLLQPPFKKILADDFGLGRIPIILSFICSLQAMGQDEGIGALIVAPATLITEWEIEIAKLIDTDTISLLVIDSQASIYRRTLKELRKFDIILSTPTMIQKQITSYEVCLRRPVRLSNFDWPLIGASRGRLDGSLMDWQCIILDDAHLIRNHGRTSQSIMKLCGKKRICVTGAPVQRSCSDLLQLLHFIQGPTLMDMTKNPKITNSLDLSSRTFECLRKKSLLRRSRLTIIDNQPIFDSVQRIVWKHEIEMSRKERQVYHYTITSFQDDWLLSSEQRRSDIAGKCDCNISKTCICGTPRSVKSSSPRIRLSGTSKLIRLRQACCDPNILPLKSHKTKNPGPSQPGNRPNKRRKVHPGNGVTTRKSSTLQALTRCVRMIGPDQAPTKVLAMIELMREARKQDSNCRFLVLSEFISMLEKTKVHLQRAGFRFVVCDGSIGSVRKQMSETALTASDACDGMLSTMGPSGMGLSLIEANIVFFLNPAWNPARHRQAEAQLFQIGQKKNVIVHYLLTPNRMTYKPGFPIEPTMEALVLEKHRIKAERELKAFVTGGEDGPAIKNLSKQDMKNIFEGEDHRYKPDIDWETDFESESGSEGMAEAWEDGQDAGEDE